MKTKRIMILVVLAAAVGLSFAVSATMQDRDAPLDVRAVIEYLRTRLDSQPVRLCIVGCGAAELDARDQCMQDPCPPGEGDFLDKCNDNATKDAYCEAMGHSFHFSCSMDCVVPYVGFRVSSNIMPGNG